MNATHCTRAAGACKPVVPFVALPRDSGLDRILEDTRLSPTAKLIVVALVKHWAWTKDHCWPADSTVAGKIGRSPGHVQRCLRELEAAGWIRRERTDAVRSGRRIWLVWRCPDSAGAQPVSAPARTNPQRRRAAKVVSVKERIEPEKTQIESIPRSRPDEAQTPRDPAVIAQVPEPQDQVSLNDTFSDSEPMGSKICDPIPQPPAPPAIALTPEQAAQLAAMPEAVRDSTTAMLLSGDRILVGEARKRLAPPRPIPAAPQTVAEVLGRLREDPTFPGLAASLLARDLNDQKSHAGYRARCEEAWRGEIAPERLVEAYSQATGPKAKNRGAIFMHALRR